MTALLLALALVAAPDAGAPDAGAPPKLTPIASYDDFAKLPALHAKGTHVIHFWASWCEPCRIEMPEFLMKARGLAQEGIDFTFISVDSPEDADSVAAPFMASLGGYFPGAHQLVLSAKVNPDRVTQLLSKAWGGEVPTTFIFRDGKKIAELHGDAETHALDGLSAPARRSSSPRPRRAR